MTELNMNELNNVTGGSTGGYDKQPKPKKGFMIYHIKKGDTLWALAKKYKTTIDDIVDANPCIKDPNFIVAGFFIYIPKVE